MGRRHSIVGKKLETAANKWKLYAKMGKIIEMKARNWSDPALNPDLAQALHKARQQGVPRDVIEKAVKKWSWLLEGVSYTEQYYEWYGPGGCAIYIKTLTDNTNRTSNDVRVTLQRHGGAIGEPWSVSWQFSHKGIITISGIKKIECIKGKNEEHIEPYDQEQLELDALESGAEDVEEEDNIMVITTSREDYMMVDKSLNAAWYHITQSDIEAVTENTITLSQEDQDQLDILLAQLEDNEDVEKVWTNSDN